MTRSKRLLSLTVPTLVVLCASVFSFGGTAHAQTLDVRPLDQNEQLIQQQSTQVVLKSTALHSTAQEVNDLQAKKQALADQLAQEQQRIADLKKQLADKKAADAAAAQAQQAAQSAPVAAPVAQAAPAVASGVVGGCGDNQYAQFIYQHESGCRLDAQNAGGCLGIGQACPGSKLLAACPDLNYACQNSFFTSYASKYGGWAGSYQFWLANGWW